MDDERRTGPAPGGPPPDDLGGDPVCWLERVCAECGGLAEDAPPAPCSRCGAVVRPA